MFFYHLVNPYLHDLFASVQGVAFFFPYRLDKPMQSRVRAKLTTNWFLKDWLFLQNVCNLQVLVRSILRYFDLNLQKHLLVLFFIFHKNHQKRGPKTGPGECSHQRLIQLMGPFLKNPKCQTGFLSPLSSTQKWCRRVKCRTAEITKNPDTRTDTRTDIWLSITGCCSRQRNKRFAQKQHKIWTLKIRSSDLTRAFFADLK